MTGVRQPAVAGRFYPDDPAQLREDVRGYLEDAAAASQSPADNVAPGRTPPPKAIIVPHAGYVYSGPVAASGYARVMPLRGTIERVVLLGPAHFVPVEGLAASSADVFETPLGPVEVDTEAVSRLSALPQVHLLDEAHAREHSLEVHLPFLQEVLGEFRVVPLAVGRASRVQVAEVLEQVWGGPETLIVVSSDLSHYHSSETARKYDLETSQTIEQGRIANLRGDRACGFLAIAGLLDAAARHGLCARTIDLRNSGDTGGGRDRVVGYGAFVFEPGRSEVSPQAEPAEELTAGDKQTLLAAAAAAIQQGIEYGKKPVTKAGDYAPSLQKLQASFVTLKRAGQLRGCMGSLLATQPLVCDVAANAYSAAFLDPRFSPLTLYEADALDLHISVLSPPEALTFDSEADLIPQLRPGVDGVTLYEENRRGTLLPAVWEKIPDPARFLQTVKQKAGLPADYWSKTVRVERYTASSFGRD